MEVVDGCIDDGVEMDEKSLEVISLNEPLLSFGDFSLEESLDIFEVPVEVLVPEGLVMNLVVEAPELVNEVCKTSSFFVVEKVEINCLQLLLTSTQSLASYLPVHHDVGAIS